MRYVLTAAILAGFSSATAVAQDGRERRMGVLQKWLRESRQQAEECFKQDMERLNRQFRERVEEFKREHGEKQKPQAERKRPHGLEDVLEELVRSVRRLEKQVGELRERAERLHKMGEDFRRLFRDQGFDWERLDRWPPRELPGWGPGPGRPLFKEHRDWFLPERLRPLKRERPERPPKKERREEEKDRQDF